MCLSTAFAGLHDMKNFAGRFSPQLYAVLRIMAGLMFALHGTQKLFGWPGGQEPAGAAMMKFAGVVELAGGLLIALGLFTSVAAFVCAGQMAAAYFMAHARQSFWPVLNQGELAALYCFLFLYVAAHGSGIWSVDGARHKGGTSTAPTGSASDGATTSSDISTPV
jgi:putative oxidoreductase